MAAELFKNSTGYKRLDVYILMNIIQLETLVFCRRFLSLENDPCGRQFDQMTQAARSGVKNLTEGSERQATSMQTTLKLIDVAKAALCELRHAAPEPPMGLPELDRAELPTTTSAQKAFANWIEAHKALLRLLYPSDPRLVEMIAAVR